MRRLDATDDLADHAITGLAAEPFVDRGETIWVHQE